VEAEEEAVGVEEVDQLFIQLFQNEKSFKMRFSFSI
jgi:hypothetical protein